MRFASLGSGSRGNATVLEWGHSAGDDAAGDYAVGCSGLVLVDCGFSVKEFERRMGRLGKSAEDLCAILVTHEHSDHIKGVGALARRYQLPVYLTQGTYRSKSLGALPKPKLINCYAPFHVQGMRIVPVPVPHDAHEPIQFVFEYAGLRLGVLTDLGSITPSVEAAYQVCDAILLEANHDSIMLASGSYPMALKQRVGGQWGHLSNQQCAGFLQRLDTERLQHLVVAHISQNNNSLAAVRAALDPVTQGVKKVTYACQDQGFDWLAVL